MSCLANDYITVELYEAEGLVSVEWRGFPGSDEYRNALLELLEMAKENNVRNWIVCTRKMSVIRPDDQSWTAKELLPKVFKEITPSRIAYIASEDVANQISLYNILNRVKEDGISVEFAQIFTSQREALNWMREEQGVVEG